MVLKEFVCLDCKEKFEEFQKDDNKITCPKCKSENVTQNYSGKCYTKMGSASGCTGNCATCKGCH